MTDIRLIDDGFGGFRPVRERDLAVERATNRGASERKTASFDVTAADNNKTFLMASADVWANLPATVDGVRVTFVTDYVASGAIGAYVSPVAADKIIGTGLVHLDDKDLINTIATAYIGDFVTLEGNGGTGWDIVDSRGVWARQS